MAALFNWIKTLMQLTTDEGQNAKGGLDMALAVLIIAESSWTTWTPQAIVVIIWLLVRAFLGWVTRGYEAIKPGMPEPGEDVHEILRRGRE